MIEETCEGLHQKSRCGTDSSTSEELVEGIQGLAVDGCSGVQCNKHSNNGDQHGVFAQEVQLEDVCKRETNVAKGGLHTIIVCFQGRLWVIIAQS